MSRASKIITTILVILPLFSIVYKIYGKSISFIPRTMSKSWHVQMTYNLDRIFESVNQDEIYLPMVSSNNYQNINDRKFLTEFIPEIFITPDGPLMLIDRRFGKQFSVQIEMDLEPTTLSQKKEKISKTQLNQIQKEYTALYNTSPKLEQKAKALSKQILTSKDDQGEKIEKFRLFIKEELSLNEATDDLEQALTLLEGSKRSQSQLLELLARINDIPARVNFGYQLTPGKRQGLYIAKKIYKPEVFIDQHWQTIELFSPHKNEFIVSFDLRKVEQYHAPEFVSISASPVMLNRVDSTLYRKKIQQTSPFFSALSLHSFPIATQAIFFTILLIPVGTLVLSFGRNIIGVPTFGIFTPVLLTLFFLETSLIIGGIFFAFIVGVGFLQRYLLDKLYLLAVPRLSILLTVVIIAYCLFTLLLHHNAQSLPAIGTLNYFPIVIVTVFIERFSVNYIEEGAANTFKTLLGTLFISLLCYIVFEIQSLRLAIFNHPEILFIIIALNILIGSYKGYRISELIRFKELRRVMK